VPPISRWARSAARRVGLSESDARSYFEWRWRRASKRTTPAATETLSDFTGLVVGKETTKSRRFAQCPSLPKFLELEYGQSNFREDIGMKIFLVPLLLLPVATLAQSPFDGTWIIETNTTQIPQKPEVYLLAKGMFQRAGEEIKADGTDQKVPETGYWDTLSVRVVDDHTVELISKKKGKTMFTEVDTISGDGETLTQVMKDTTEAQAVTIETLSKRVDQGPAGSHALSGSWQAYKVSRSRNGSIITYKCTADGFSAETPLGEKFNARFDGKDYPVEDDPAHTMVSVKLLSPNTVDQTSKRKGKVVGVLRLTVAPGNETIHATFENKEANTTTSFEMRKQPE
ncbi:MAG: hypothetical protein WA853_21450, partial [Candidatus Acidiferrum sp.]